MTKKCKNDQKTKICTLTKRSSDKKFWKFIARNILKKGKWQNEKSSKWQKVKGKWLKDWVANRANDKKALKFD